MRPRQPLFYGLDDARVTNMRRCVPWETRGKDTTIEDGVEILRVFSWLQVESGPGARDDTLKLRPVKTRPFR
jgi:hypothetical protein